jgi:hypothetical protein
VNDATSVAPALEAVGRFFEALRAQRWDAAAEMVDEDAAAAFRESELASLTGWAQHRDAMIAASRRGESMGWSSDERLDRALLEQHSTIPMRGIRGIHSLGELVALPPAAFVAKCLEVTNEPMVAPSGERVESSRRVLGGVSDGETYVHVLFRVEAPGLQHTDPRSVEVIRLKQSQGVWRVDLTTFNWDIASARSAMMITDLDLGAGPNGDLHTPDA